MDKLNTQRGFSIIEILIAMAIAVIVISGTVAASGGFGSTIRGYQSTITNSETNAEAVTMAQQVLEQEQTLAREDFSLVNPTTTVATSGPLAYTKTVTVTLQPDFLTKLVTATITWLGDHNQPMSTKLSTLVTNLDNVNSPSTCSSILSGDWKHPQMTSYEFGKDLLGDSSSGYPITDVDIHDHKLYVTVNNTHGNNNGTLFIFSLANPTVPALLTQIDNAPSPTSQGLNAISVASSSAKAYAYVASANQANYTSCTNSPAGSNPACAQFQVIDVSVTPPQVKYSMKIPGVKGNSGQAIGKSIFYKDGYIYLGLAKTSSGTEFNIIDVHDPLNPVWKGGYAVGNAINSIFVKGAYAYIATPNAENMTVINVSDPTNPTRVGGYSPAGGNNGESVWIVGTTAYLGRTFGSNEFNILNVTDPTSVSLIANKDIGSTNDTTIWSMVVRDYLAFLLTDSKFEIWNISNPANIYPWTPSALTSEFLDLPVGSGTTLNCEGQYMYLGSVPSNDKGYIAVVNPGP